MTIRVAVIGNSHLSALALAWRELAPRHPAISMTFFGARAFACEGLRVSERGLRPDNDRLRGALRWLSGGHEEIVVADHDVFLFAGHDFGVHPVIGVYAECWAEAHATDPARTPVSDSLFAELCDEALRRTLSMELLRRLRQVTGSPAAILCQPAPLAPVRGMRDPRVRGYGVAYERNDTTLLAAQADAALTRIARQEGVEVFRQPAETLEQPLHSHPDFSRGSVRLANGLASEHPRTDMMHMNAAYGVVALEPVLTALVDPARLPRADLAPSSKRPVDNPAREARREERRARRAARRA